MRRAFPSSLRPVPSPGPLPCQSPEAPAPHCFIQYKCDAKPASRAACCAHLPLVAFAPSSPQSRPPDVLPPAHRVGAQNRRGKQIQTRRYRAAPCADCGPMDGRLVSRWGPILESACSQRRRRAIMSRASETPTTRGMNRDNSWPGADGDGEWYRGAALTRAALKIQRERRLMHRLSDRPMRTGKSSVASMGRPCVGRLLIASLMQCGYHRS